MRSVVLANHDGLCKAHAIGSCSHFLHCQKLKYDYYFYLFNFFKYALLLLCVQQYTDWAARWWVVRCKITVDMRILNEKLLAIGLPVLYAPHTYELLNQHRIQSIVTQSGPIVCIWWGSCELKWHLDTQLHRHWSLITKSVYQNNNEIRMQKILKNGNLLKLAVDWSQTHSDAYNSHAFIGSVLHRKCFILHVYMNLFHFFIWINGVYLLDLTLLNWIRLVLLLLFFLFCFFECSPFSLFSPLSQTLARP